MRGEVFSEPIAAFDVESPPRELDLESVWPALQRGGFRRSEAINAQVEALLSLGRALVRPRAIARLYAVGSMLATQLESLPAPILEAEFLCFGLCTAGQDVDDRTRELRAAGELIDSMILDAMALTGLSWIGDELGQRIFSWAAGKGLAASRAFSPGAGQWELNNQRLVFDHLPAERFGVRLTEHYLMQPSKCVSFVIGIGGRVKQVPYPFSCEGCTRVDCAYRHVPSAEMVQSEKP